MALTARFADKMTAQLDEISAVTLGLPDDANTLTARKAVIAQAAGHFGSLNAAFASGRGVWGSGYQVARRGIRRRGTIS